MHRPPSRRAAFLSGALALGLLVACTARAGIDTDRADGTAPEGSVPDVSGPDGSVVPTEPATTDDAVAPPTSPDDAGPLPSISEVDPEVLIGQLANGLRYYIRENDNPGERVEMRLAVDAGSGIQDDDQGGGAHFLEHMLFNGTEQFPRNQLVDVLRSFGAAFGADINASTSYDETVYQLTMPSDDPEIVRTGLDVLEQWLTSATIDPDEVVAERGIVLDEWRGSEQSSSGRIFDELEQLFLAGSPYEGKDPIGTAEEIRSTEADTLRRYYDDWYRPDNVALVVVGDIDAERIEEEILIRFEPVSDRGSGRDRPVLEVQPADDPQVRELSDPDLAKGFAFVNLPTSVDETLTPEESAEQEVLLGLAFDIVANRLSDDARRGVVPFDSASVDTSSFVRDLDAPEIVVEGDAADLGAGVQAIIDEYERVARFGVGDGELRRAVATRRRAAQTVYEARDTRQDASFADEYVRNALTGEPIPTADAAFDFVTAALDRATPEMVAAVFTERYGTAAPHAFVAAPAAEADAGPTVDEVKSILDGAADRELEPRAEDLAIDDALMEPPDKADVVDEEELGAGFIEPVVVRFENGVQVGLTVTPVVEGSVAFEARSPGGLGLVGDEVFPDAQAAPQVVAESGAGPFGPVELEAFLADQDVGLTPFIEQSYEGFRGGAASTDLETLFQLVYLAMTDPQVDAVALDRYVTDTMAIAADPSVDPSYAGFDALLRARYEDPRRWLPTVESAAAVDADGVEAVFRDRFGDATDFAFSLAGDFDLDDARELAARYLGTLPGAGRLEEPAFDEPAPPAGIVVEEVRAGTGERASLSILHTNPARADRREEVMGLVVGTAISNRLTDTIREELGESYSPFGLVEFTDGPGPNAETFVSVSTSPELLDQVAVAVEGQLAALENDGVDEQEYASAVETARRELELFSNLQVNDEVLRALLDPEGTDSFQEFFTLAAVAADIDHDEVDAALDRWLDEEQFIRVDVLPR